MKIYSLILILIVIPLIESVSFNISVNWSGSINQESVNRFNEFRPITNLNETRTHGKVNLINHRVSESTGRGILARPTESVGRKNAFGTPATFGQFPFFGYIIVYLTESQISVNMCGSTLISTIHVLLAAQCIPQGFYAAQIFFGLIDKVSISEFRDAVAYAVHPGYNDPPRSNDIALLILSSPIVPSFRVAPVELPRQIPNSDIMDNNDWIRVVGFEQDGNGSSSGILSYNFLSKTSYEECWSITKSSLTTICAQDLAANSTCFADAGSPLILDKMIIGIAVTDDSQCRNGINIFTRVSPYLEWILMYTTN